MERESRSLGSELVDLLSGTRRMGMALRLVAILSVLILKRKNKIRRGLFVGKSL